MNAALTETETKFLQAMQLRMSDRKRCEMLGLTLEQAIRMSAAVRGKLGLAVGASLRGIKF